MSVEKRGKHKWIVGKKRVFPRDGMCEVCGKFPAKHYHHWDDNNLMKGVWVCVPCHKGIEWVDGERGKSLRDRWPKLKAMIEQSIKEVIK